MVAEFYSPIHKETRPAGRPTTGTPATRNNNRPDLFADLEWFVSLHQIINYVKDKIGVVFLRSCVIFDTL